MNDRPSCSPQEVNDALPAKIRIFSSTQNQPYHPAQIQSITPTGGRVTIPAILKPKSTFHLHVGHKGEVVVIKGTVMRSMLKGFQQAENGQKVSLYQADLRFDRHYPQFLQ